MIDFPAIKPASISWGFQRNIIRNESMGGLVTRIARTGDRWMMSLQMPPLQDADARLFRNFALRANAFDDWVASNDPSYVFSGPSDLSALVLASGSGKTLQIKTNKNNTLIASAGDRFQLSGGGVYELAASATTDGSGHVTLSLAMPLHRSPAVDESVNFHDPRAAFISDTEIADWAITPPLIHSFTMSFTEDTSANAPAPDQLFPVLGRLLKEDGDLLLQENNFSISY